MSADLADLTGASSPPRDWPIIAGLLAGGLVVYAALAYVLYAVISAVF